MKKSTGFITDTILAQEIVEGKKFALGNVENYENPTIDIAHLQLKTLWIISDSLMRIATALEDGITHKN